MRAVDRVGGVATVIDEAILAGNVGRHQVNRIIYAACYTAHKGERHLLGRGDCG